MAVMIQARHLFYGLSMLDKFKGLGWNNATNLKKIKGLRPHVLTH